MAELYAASARNDESRVTDTDVQLLDYTSTKGAIVAFTRALSNQIVKTKGIRVKYASFSCRDLTP